MAAELSVSVSAELTGLGKDQNFIERATDGTTPTAATYNYRVLATTNSEEALDLGDVATVTLLAIKTVDYDLDVDLDYADATFNKDFTLKAGEPAAVIPNPVLIYVKNNTADQTPAYEYLLVGTT